MKDRARSHSGQRPSLGSAPKILMQNSVLLGGDFFFSRLLNSVASTSGTQDGINDVGANKQQTFAMLKSLLQFYQDSEVRALFFFLSFFFTSNFL